MDAHGTPCPARQRSPTQAVDRSRSAEPVGPMNGLLSGFAPHFSGSLGVALSQPEFMLRPIEIACTAACTACDTRSHKMSDAKSIQISA